MTESDEGAPDRATGIETRRRVHGEIRCEGKRSTPVFEAFDEFITSAAWGKVWGRPGLDLRTRSLVTIALLVALDNKTELERHIRSARLRTGCTTEEIAEAIFHTSVYSGVPGALDASRLADRVFQEIDMEKCIVST